MKNFTKSPNLILVLLFALLTITACQKDDGPSINNGSQQETIPDNFSDYFGNSVSKNFIGNVIDDDKSPIEGVTITIGNETATTDSNGVFIINNASVNERFGYIKAEKQGYIHGSRAVVPTDGTNKVTIMLLEANTTETISSGNASTVTANDGSSVSFDGNFIKEDGTEYTGSVDVILHHLDPADEDMPLQMPGMLYAQNEAGAERMLQTMGMLAVELRGEAGEDLNLPEGSTSEIRIPLDPSLMGIAPTTIPLWYFDEVNGYWKEEGEATLQGNIYVGTVSHFSFWNCDIPAEAVTLCVNAINSNEEPLNNLWVSITSATFGTTYGYTNENGEVCGYVPSNETLELNIYSYDNCSDTPLYTETIGPFTADSSLLAIVSDNTDVVSETVIGMFNTCNGNPVTDGYVQLTYGDQTFVDAVNNGAFEINLLRCTEDDTFVLKGNDYANLQSTGNIAYTFTTPLTDVGAISACNEVDEFIQFTIDDQETVYILENIYANFYAEGQGQTTNNATLDIFGGGNDQETCFYIYGVLSDPDYLGTYDSLDWNTEGDTGFFIGECLSVSNVSNAISYNLNTLGEVGEYIDVNFTGTYEDYNGEPHTISGTVHVIRDN
ncbi:carboxypeptidase-like regulatory domain-containing protein [Winogradskyella poriferorum]|uniref:carboxypeptidase-like regulatory domain-containing protein n=1 Tax=Winogradskyella poriferorum TaxID=307627 RepID=UPI003D653B83